MTAPAARAPAPARPRDHSWLAGLGSGLVTGALVVALGLAMALAVVPRFLDGAALTVLTGSMEPTYSPGDVVVIERVAAADLTIGDVVTFQAESGDPALTTHRVVAQHLAGDGTKRFVTRGDANGTTDDPLVIEQIRGRVVYHVPYVGHATVWAGEHRGGIVAGAGAALLAYAAFSLLRPLVGGGRR